MSAPLIKNIVLAAVGTPLLTGVALAQSIPSMVGTWKGTSSTITVPMQTTASQIGHDWNKPVFLERKIEMHITNQKGNRFWGKVFGNGKLDGSLIGAIGADGKTVAMVGPNATSFAFLLSPSRLNYCYTDPDVTTGDKAYKAGCSTLIKQ